jgi:parvulin-like peptidyl-prolyl isomerase
MDGIMNKIMIVFMALYSMLFSVVAAPKHDVAECWSFLPEIVAEINGEKMTRTELVKNVVGAKLDLATASRDQLESLAKITLKQQIEKYIIRRLMQRDGIIPSAKLVLEEYQKTFSALSPTGQATYLKKLDLTRVQLPEHWRQLSLMPTEQFRMAFTLWVKNRILTIAVTDDEIETFYREYQDKFKQPERVTIRTAMVTFIKQSEGKAAREKIEDILALVRQGVDFNQQAEKYRVPDNALNGNFRRGVLPKKIEDIVFSMKTGQISEIIEMPVGFVIIKLEHRVSAGYIPLDKVKPELKLELKRDKTARWFRKKITIERAKIDIKNYLK